MKYKVGDIVTPSHDSGWHKSWLGERFKVTDIDDRRGFITTNRLHERGDTFNLPEDSWIWAEETIIDKVLKKYETI
jgi:hypothetical protein